jgi:UDP-glucose 4-epimerase
VRRIFLTEVAGGLLADELSRLPEVECLTGIDVVDPPGPLPSKMRFVKMGVRSPDLAKAMAGHDIVVHTAFVVLWRAQMPAAVRDDVNLNGTRNVAQAAKANGAKRLIHTSSTAAYDPFQMARQTGLTEEFPLGFGNASFYYSDSKACAEKVLHTILDESSTFLTILRPCAIVGPRCQRTLLILRRTCVNLPWRNPRMQFIHEQDLSAAFLQAVSGKIGSAFNIVPGDFVRINQIRSIIGMRPLFVPAPLLLLGITLDWRWRGGTVHPYWVGARMSDFTASNAKLKATGWRPRYGSAEARRSAVGKA